MSHSHSHHHQHGEHDEAYEQAHGHGHGLERGERHHSGHDAHAEHSGPRLDAHASGSAEEVAGYLSALAEGLRTGGVTIRSGSRAVGLRLDGDVALDLRAMAGNGGMSHLALDLAWQTPQVAPVTPMLEILSTEDAMRQAEEQRGETHEHASTEHGEASGTEQTGMPG